MSYYFKNSKVLLRVVPLLYAVFIISIEWHHQHHYDLPSSDVEKSDASELPPNESHSNIYYDFCYACFFSLSGELPLLEDSGSSTYHQRHYQIPEYLIPRRDFAHSNFVRGPPQKQLLILG